MTLIGLLAFFLDIPNVHLGYDSRMCQTCQDKYQNRKFISATTHRSRKLARHTHTTLSHTLFREQLCHTHTRRHSFTHNFITRNFGTHTHAHIFVTHTTLPHTNSSHATSSHTHTIFHTHTHNFITHTTLSHTSLSHTHSFVTHNLSHTRTT